MSIAPWADVINLPSTRQFRDAFRERGFVLVRDFLMPRFADEFCRCVAALRQRYGVAIDRVCEDGSLRYTVVTGDCIRSSAPQLFELYTSDALIEWIQRVTSCASVDVSPHVRSSINVNVLEEIGEMYPWHTDAVPFTAVLFLSSLSNTAGGELMLKTLDGEVTSIRPRCGQWLLMDGARCAHAVAALREKTNRVTIPMVYPARAIPRPAGLDEFLYGDF